MTADGHLRNCLFSDDGYDLVPVLRRCEPAPGEDVDAAVDAVLRACVSGKLPGHAIDDPGFLQPTRGMNAIVG